MLTIADKLYIDSNGNIGIGTSPTASLDFSNRTDGIIVPRGTVAQRPSTGYNGMVRFNTDASVNAIEMYVNGVWTTASSYRPVILGVGGQTSLYDNVLVGVDGLFFETDQKWSLIGKDGTIYYPTVTFNSLTNVTIQAPNDISTNNVPYVIKVHSKRSGIEFISPSIRFDLSPVSYSVPVITSAVPADISQNVYSSSYSAPYTFTATGGNISWTLVSYKRTDVSGNISWTDISNPYGNINRVTSDLTLLFPQYTLGSGYFKVTATNTLGFQDISWNYNVVGQFKPVITPSSVSTLNKSTNKAAKSESYAFTATGGVIIWSNTPTTYGTINESGQLNLTFAQNATASGVMKVTAANDAGTTDVSWNFNVINTLFTALQTSDTYLQMYLDPNSLFLSSSYEYDTILSSPIPANTAYVESNIVITTYNSSAPDSRMKIKFDVYDGSGTLITTVASEISGVTSINTILYFAQDKSTSQTYKFRVRSYYSSFSYGTNAGYWPVNITYRVDIKYG